MAKKNEQKVVELYGIDLPTVYDFTDKPRRIADYMAYMLIRTSRMFEWKNLPETIPQRELELMLQSNGHICIAKVNGELYALKGTFAGKPNAYYTPSNYLVANPFLNLSKEYVRDKDCVMVYNDSMYYGLLPMFNKYATLLTETDVTMNMSIILERVKALVSANDNKTKEAGDKFLNDIKEGKLGIIAETAFLEGLKSQPFGSSAQNTLTQLIEVSQYYKSIWLNDIGLTSNYNMKREAVNSSEAQLGDDALLPLIDDMLMNRQKAVEEINAKYGTNIEVTLCSAWKQNAEEDALALEQMKNPSTEGKETEE